VIAAEIVRTSGITNRLLHISVGKICIAAQKFIAAAALF